LGNENLPYWPDAQEKRETETRRACTSSRPCCRSRDIFVTIDGQRCRLSKWSHIATNCPYVVDVFFPLPPSRGPRCVCTRSSLSMILNRCLSDAHDQPVSFYWSQQYRHHMPCRCALMIPIKKDLGNPAYASLGVRGDKGKELPTVAGARIGR
jgi:hypothetical protein